MALRASVAPSIYNKPSCVSERADEEAAETFFLNQNNGSMKKAVF